MYNTKNYTEAGGERTVIGGELEILDGAKVMIHTGAEMLEIEDTPVPGPEDIEEEEDVGSGGQGEGSGGSGEDSGGQEEEPPPDVAELARQLAALTQKLDAIRQILG